VSHGQSHRLMRSRYPPDRPVLLSHLCAGQQLTSTFPRTLRTCAPPADRIGDVSAGSGGFSSTTSAAAGRIDRRRGRLLALGLTPPLLRF